MLCCQSNSSPPECTCWCVKVHLQANRVGQREAGGGLNWKQANGQGQSYLALAIILSTFCPPVPAFLQPAISLVCLYVQASWLLLHVWPALSTQLHVLTSSLTKHLDFGIREIHFGILTSSLTMLVTLSLCSFTCQVEALYKLPGLLWGFEVIKELVRSSRAFGTQ